MRSGSALMVLVWLASVAGLGVDLARAQRPARAVGLRHLLATLPEATVVRVCDDWDGLSFVAPIQNSYDFERSGAEFRVHAVCRAAGQEHPLPVATLPAAPVLELLHRLASSRLRQGAYHALSRQTDGYPDVQIEVVTSSDTLAFTSPSQGSSHSPSKLHAGAESAVVESPIVGAVFSELVRLGGGPRCAEWVQQRPDEPRHP